MFIMYVSKIDFITASLVINTTSIIPDTYDPFDIISNRPHFQFNVTDKVVTIYSSMFH